MNLFIRVNDVLKFDTLRRAKRLVSQNLDGLVTCMDLADAVDRTHDELVKMAAEEKM